jgi:hypothetical protein
MKAAPPDLIEMLSCDCQQRSALGGMTTTKSLRSDKVTALFFNGADKCVSIIIESVEDGGRVLSLNIPFIAVPLLLEGMENAGWLPPGKGI